MSGGRWNSWQASSTCTTRGRWTWGPYKTGPGGTGEEVGSSFQLVGWGRGLGGVLGGGVGFLHPLHFSKSYGAGEPVVLC